MNKKGSEAVQLLLVTYLILSIIILISGLYIVQKNLTGAGALKEFIVRDTSMLVNTIHTPTGNLEIKYNLNHQYNFDFKESQTKIKSGNQIERKNTYPYFTNDKYILDSSVKNFEKKDETCNIIFTKSDNEITIEKGDQCNA